MQKAVTEKSLCGVVAKVQNWDIVVSEFELHACDYLHFRTNTLGERLKFTKLFASMWHKAEWMGRPMRLELTRVGLLVQLANRYTTRGALPLGKGTYIPMTLFMV